LVPGELFRPLQKKVCGKKKLGKVDLDNRLKRRTLRSGKVT